MDLEHKAIERPLPLNRLYHMDCMDGMAHFPDGYFDLAIVDPPYFSGPNKRRYYGCEVNKLRIKRVDYPVIDTWDVPDAEYFDELRRVSKQQIIWGCNNFDYPFGSGRIIWDKCNADSSFSDCEIAYCSLHDSVRLFRYMWNGMLQGKSVTQGHIMQGDKRKNEKRIHPCQKPVALYDWLLMRYLPNGGKVIDTHVGSGSSLIACEKAGVEYIGFEIDETVFKLASERIEEHKSQVTLAEVLNG